MPATTNAHAASHVDGNRVTEAWAFLRSERGRIVGASWTIEHNSCLGMARRQFDVTLKRDDGQTLRIGSTWDLEEAQITATRYPDCAAMIGMLNALADGVIEDDWDEQDALFTSWAETDRGSEWIEQLHFWLQREDLKGKTSINFEREAGL